MDQPGGSAAGSASEVTLLQQGDLQSAHSRIPRYARARYTSPDDHDVELSALHLLQVFPPCLGGELGWRR